jgi:NitT/TauT family transport system substrate-binding protein
VPSDSYVRALAQNMYWFLVVRKDVGRRGDLACVKGLRIGAAPGPVDGLKQLLKRNGIDPAKDLQIGPVPGFAVGQTASFGLLAAKALEEGKIDGFWANGMGAEVAVRSGIGTLVLDARREGTAEAKGYTFPALVCTEKTIRERPDDARAAIRAVQQAQKALKEHPNRATDIGKKLFPPAEAGIIAELVRRDAQFYDPVISPKSVEAMYASARDIGLLSRPVSYKEVVWSG